MRLRSLDDGDLRAYLHELRPRFLTLRRALGRDLLALPDGVPLLDVAAGDAHIVIAEARP